MAAIRVHRGQALGLLRAALRVLRARRMAVVQLGRLFWHVRLAQLSQASIMGQALFFRFHAGLAAGLSLDAMSNRSISRVMALSGRSSARLASVWQGGQYRSCRASRAATWWSGLVAATICRTNVCRQLAAGSDRWVTLPRITSRFECSHFISCHVVCE